MSDSSSAWFIDSLPLVTIGSQESTREGDEYEFHTIQGVAMMPSREILVADWGSTSVRVYDSTGVYQRTLVRKGSGPGELTTVSQMHRTRHDSVYVYNGESASMAVFTPGLKLARSVARIEFLPDSQRREYSAPGVHGIFDDGTVLGSNRYVSGIDRKKMKIEDGYVNVTDSTYWVRAIADDRQLAEYGWLVGRRLASARISSYQYQSYTNNLPQGLVATRGTDLLYVDGQRYEVRTFGADGSIRQFIRMPMTPIKVTESTFRGFPKDTVKRALAPSPATYPLIDALHVDLKGNIWLASRHPTAKQPARFWHVFDSTGTLQHRVFDRSGMKVGEIGDDYLLGTTRDRDGVESVVIHRLRKRPSFN